MKIDYWNMFNGGALMFYGYLISTDFWYIGVILGIFTTLGITLEMGD